MKYLYLHSAHPGVARARGLPAFVRWKMEQDRHVYLTSQLNAGVWEFVENGNTLILADLPAVEPWVRFVEAAVAKNVVLVDVHHPIWRPDLQMFTGDDDKARMLWNHPTTINLIERSLKAAEAVITPRFVWGSPTVGGQEEYNQLSELMAHNRHIHEIADIKTDDDVGLFEIELEMAFHDAARRKGLA